MPRVSLPRFIDTGAVKGVVRQYREEHFQQIFNMFQNSLKDSTGVGEGEFSNKQQLEEYIDRAFVKVTIHDCDADEKLFGFSMLYPTPLSRSAAPKYAAGYFLLDPAYRGKHLQAFIWQLSFDMCVDVGCPGFVGRMAVTAKTPVAAYRAGWQFIANVPRSMKIPQIGWVFDLVGVRDFIPLMTRHEREQVKSAIEEIPNLVENVKSITTLQPSDSLIEPRVISLKDESQLRIKGADKQEVKVVENIIWVAATDGDGFGLDEFCRKDGHFLHKFILEPKVVVATNHHGDVLGSAICGISGITRVPGSLFAAYFIVQKSNRRKGIATALLDAVCELSMKNDCDMLFFDVFANNPPATEWLYKQGFITTGSIPHCGYVANTGYTSSLLMYKQLYDTTSKI